VESKESLLKEQDQYSWPPPTHSFRSTFFIKKISLISKQAILTRSTEHSPSVRILWREMRERGDRRRERIRSNCRKREILTSMSRKRERERERERERVREWENK
jgi:hypothetical protein